MRVSTLLFRYFMSVVGLILLHSHTQNAVGQNLIPNPGFENTGSVPCGWTTSASAFSNAVAHWTMPANGTPDVHSTLVNDNCWNAQPASNYAGWDCWRGGQSPRSGQTMVGLFTVANSGTWREYLQVKLISPMIPGQAYDIGFYVCLANSSSLATNNLGIHMSTTSVSGGWGHMALNPQIVESNIVTDTSNWAYVGGTMIASSAFEYITIGNFSTNANTAMLARQQPCDGAYYFIDDACVSLSASASCAQTILDAQLLDFTALPNADHTVTCTWEIDAPTGISHFLLQRSEDGITFENLTSVDIDPQATTYTFPDLSPLNEKSFYRVLQSDHNGQQYFSEVREVQVNPGPRLQVFPNPSNGEAPQLVLDQMDGSQVDIRIFDAQGRTHYLKTHGLLKGHLELHLKNLVQLAPGMYIVSYKTSTASKSAFFFVN